MKQSLILVSMLAFGTAAFAAPAKNAPVIAHFNGTVASYDTAARTLTIRHSGKNTPFQLNDKSQVMKGKTTADPSALAVSAGQTVKVEYVMDGATRVAEKVVVAPAAAHAATMKKK